MVSVVLQSLKSRKMFSKRWPQQRSLDLFLLPPPCKSELKYHMLRALFLAKLRQSKPTSCTEASEITDFSWDVEGKPIWVAEFFPGDVNLLNLLLNKSNQIEMKTMIL